MPALGSPIVRQLRRMASAYEDAAGSPSNDPLEVLGAFEAELGRKVISRRGALVGAGTLAAAALGVARAPRAMAARDASVVVIGAGLGGLSCTYRLRRHGISATLYEGQERLGGRCFSIRGFFDAEQTAEHGGQYIDSRHRHIRSLAKELGIPLVDTFEQSFPAGSLDPLWLDGGLRDPAEVFADFGIFMDRLRADYRRVGRYFYNQAGPEAVDFDHMTMTEWFEANLPGGAGSLLGLALGTFMQSFFGLEPNDMSAINLFEAFVFPYPGADERFRVAGGNDMVVQGLQDALPAQAIRTGHALEAAWMRGDGRLGLRFSGLASDVVADRVVFALPFTVLRDLDLSRLPLSSRKRRAIAQLAMGTNAKLNLQLDRSIAALDWTGSFSSDEPHYVTWDSTYGQTNPAPATPVLTVYNGGREGASYPTEVAHAPASPRVVAEVLANLERGVPGVADAWNGLAFLDSWVDDPWVRGSYAGFGPGQYTDFWGFLGLREGPVHFAGEHTSTFSQGYLNGGVESGERAAREVMNALGVPVQHSDEGQPAHRVAAATAGHRGRRAWSLQRATDIGSGHVRSLARR
jgi:monoamine oxidase